MTHMTTKCESVVFAVSANEDCESYSEFFENTSIQKEVIDNFSIVLL